MGFREFGTFRGAVGVVSREQRFRNPVIFHDKVTFEWATNRIVIENGTIKGFTTIIGSDIISANWDGSDPLVLATPNAITAGYAFDDSLGTAQFAANLFVGTDTSYIAINGIGGGSDAIVFHDEQGAGLDPPLVDAFIVHDVSDLGGGIDAGSLWLNSFVWSGQDGAAMLLWGSSNTGSHAANVSFHIGGSETVQINALAMNPGTDKTIDMGIANLAWDNIFTERIKTGAGTAALPSHAFHGDTNTGMYRFDENQIGFAVAGGVAMRIGDSTSNKDVTFGDGGTGKGFILNAAGSVSFPTYAFVGDKDLGTYRVSANVLGFAAGGGKRASVHTYGLSSENKVIVRGSVLAHDPDTTGSSASAHYTGTSIGEGVARRLVRVTSARRYKTHITYDVDYLADIELRPAHFYRKDDKAWYYGFIADDLGDQNRMLATYDEDGLIENYDTRAVVAVLAAKVERLENRLTNCPNCAKLDPPTTHGDSHAPIAD